MTKLYIITGFLGAGKTTFLKEFVQLFPGEKLAIVINEFGKEDVDGKLLSRLHAEMESIHSGSIFCACRLDQFEHAFLRLMEKEPDTVIVETSGLSDPSSIKDVLRDLGEHHALDYRGCICLADAVNFVKSYTTALAARKQISVSDVIVLNKVELADEVSKGNIRSALHAARPAAPVLETNRGAIPIAWKKTLLKPVRLPHDTSPNTRDLSIQSYVLCVDERMPLKTLKELLGRFAGVTHRIKGFVQLAGRVYLVDCVGGRLSVEPYNGDHAADNRLVVLAGQGQPAGKALQQAIEQFSKNGYALHLER